MSCRRERAGLAGRGAGGPLPRARGSSSFATTRFRPCTAASATTPARMPATAASWTRRSASTPSNVSSATSRSSSAGHSARPPPASGKRILVVGAGPSGLSAAWQLARRGHAVSIFDAGPVAGGMMHFGIPKYRLPREVLDAEIARIVRPRRRDLAQSHGRGSSGQRRRTAASMPCSWPSAHTSASARTFPPRDCRESTTRCSSSRQVEAGDEPQIGRRVAIYGGGNTAMDAARTARRLGAEPLIIYRRTRERDAGARLRARGGARRGDHRFTGCAPSRRLTAPRSTVEVMRAGRQPAPRADRRVRDARGRFARPGARAGDRHDISEDRRPASSSRPTARSSWATDMQTGHPGVFAGGDMVPYERTVTTAVGHGKKAARHIDAWLRGTGDRRRREARARDVRDAASLVSRRRRRSAAQSTIDLERRRHDVRRGHRRPRRRRPRGTKRSGASRAATASSATAAYSACPERRSSSWAQASATSTTSSKCTGCAICLRPVPVRRDRRWCRNQPTPHGRSGDVCARR